VNHPHRVWLGLGANLGDAHETLRAMVDRFADDDRFSGIRASSAWRGPYVGPLAPQPDYVNLCMTARTALGPRMRRRRFVLEPLAELEPGLALPPDGVTVAALLRGPEVAGQELELVATECGRDEGVSGGQR
jgi:7,8-dihydro-6-hydroxymethylpterin-pyrophosphokinase